MGRALLILGWLATAGLLSTGWLGFQVTPENGVGLHLLVALFSSLLALFSHSWIMFYLIGTGKAIKTAVWNTIWTRSTLPKQSSSRIEPIRR